MKILTIHLIIEVIVSTNVKNLAYLFLEFQD